uniref:Uncharacterized protein n=1 Tax=Schistosoma japonicum TaxID=6182 RepID=Q5BWT2_SCHJA|nr:unknown [Schistosoma japonicum]
MTEIYLSGHWDQKLRATMYSMEKKLVLSKVLILIV